jgi:hypothetical protein
LLALVVTGAIYAQGDVLINGALGITNIIVHDEGQTAFASFWLAMGGGAEPVLVYWNQLR